MNSRTFTKSKIKNSTILPPAFDNDNKSSGRKITSGSYNGGHDISNPEFGHNFGDVRVECGRTFIQSRPPRIQKKLKINQPGDKYEIEADRVAAQVMRMPETELQPKACSSCNDNDDEELNKAKSIAGLINPLVQRQETIPEEEEEEEPIQTKLLVQRQVEEEEEEEELLQAKTENSKTPKFMPKLTAHIKSLQGRGRPLTDSVRAFFEPRFGHDFRHVRVHTGTRLDDMVNGVNALALTFGRDIVFREGEYSPHSNKGKQLLAHELTHVVQQGYSREKPTTQLIPECIQMKIGLQNISTRVGIKKHIKKTYWKELGLKEGKNKPGVASMIDDDIHRVFKSAAEANDYTSGNFDYMGDVKKHTFVKLDPDKTYVLGEIHKDSAGTAMDVIEGVGTNRFMSESVEELSRKERRKFPETQKRIKASLKKVGSSKFAGKIDKKKYPPALENLVVKTMVVPYFVSDFVKDARNLTQDALKIKWQYGVAGPGEYTYSNTIAGLLTDAIVIARDVNKGRKKKLKYQKYQGFLNGLVLKYQKKPFSGLYEFATIVGEGKQNVKDAVKALEAFNNFYTKWVVQYAKKMGRKSGRKIAGLNITEHHLLSQDPRDEKKPIKSNEAREIIMLKKLRAAKRKGYLIVGMGDSHRRSLEKITSKLPGKWPDEWDSVRHKLSASRKFMAELYRDLKWGG